MTTNLKIKYKRCTLHQYVLNQFSSEFHAVPPLPLRRVHRIDAPFPHPRPLAPNVCGWMQIIIIDGQLHPWKDMSNLAPKKSENEVRASLHNPVKLFWLLTSFNVGNNFTSTNSSNILSEFLCSLTKVSHGFKRNKTNKKKCCSHGNRKWTMALFHVSHWI